MESLPSMVAGVWSNDNNLQLEATTQFRKLLSIGMTKPAPASFMLVSFNFLYDLTCGLWLTERSPPIEEVIQSGVVPRFVEFLMREDFPQLQVWEWCLITLFVPSLAFHVVASHLLYRCGYAFIVWSCLGSHKHCFWYLGEYQSGDWSWGGANFCKASGFSKWWCPWAGVFWKWVDPYAV